MPETRDKEKWRSAMMEGWLVWFEESVGHDGLPALQIEITFDDEEQRARFCRELFADEDCCPPR